jgi:hypothetical protein
MNSVVPSKLFAGQSILCVGENLIPYLESVKKKVPSVLTVPLLELENPDLFFSVNYEVRSFESRKHVTLDLLDYGR